LTTAHPRVILKKGIEKSPGSAFWEDLRRKASARKKRILFAESTDARVLSAAAYLKERGLVEPVLVGSPDAVRSAAAAAGVGLAGIEIADHLRSPEREAFAGQLYERRKAKGLSPEAARTHLEDPLYFAAMSLAASRADGLVAGAVRTTADTVKAAFACLGLAPGASTVFGFFLMDCPHAAGGPRRLVLADCAVSPEPSARALAAVGVGAAEMCRKYLGETPRVAYLSFSTRGSAEHERVAKAREAAQIARKKAPDLASDGELQADAALVRDIAEQKGAGDSDVAGRANVLVFPDLDAGNAAYKLVQHLGGARAVGPLLAGLAKPVSDLSRGCNDEDVADAACLVSLLQ
jgi:phosphate acetyltransferase